MNDNIAKNLVAEITIQESVILCCLYFLEKIEPDFKKRVEVLSLPSGNNKDFKYINYNGFIYDDWKKLYNIKISFLDKNFKELRNKLFNLPIINYAKLAYKHISKDAQELVFAESNILSDKHIHVLSMDDIENIDKQFVIVFVDLINLFIKYGIVQFGINDKSQVNVQMYRKDNFSPILVFGLYDKILFTARDEDRIMYDRKVCWIEINDYINLIVKHCTDKLEYTMKLICSIYNKIANNDKYVKYNLLDLSVLKFCK